MSCTTTLYHHRMNQITRSPDNAVHPFAAVSESFQHFFVSLALSRLYILHTLPHRHEPLLYVIPLASISSSVPVIQTKQAGTLGK